MDKDRSFLEKIRFRYKIYVLNENTLEEKFKFRLSRLSLFLFVCFFSIVSFTIFSLIVLVTPLKQFLPGYADASAREALISEAIRVDSISSAMDSQARQLNIIKHIINGTIPIDTLNTADSLTLASLGELSLERTPEESEFAKKFEEESKYYLQSITDVTKIPSSDSRLFMKPVNGTIISEFNPKNNEYGIMLNSKPQEAIMAIDDGRIILASDEGENGYTIIVQHENGFISIYKHIHALIKKTNDMISAGEALAISDMGTHGDMQSHIHFELWQNGIPLNPTEYIIF